MPQVDFIQNPFTVSKTLTFDQKELYRYFKKWYTERHYIVVETSYSEKIGPGGKIFIQFNWYTEKRIEDTTKLSLELDFEAEFENVQMKLHDGMKKTAQKGTVTATFSGYIQKDVEDEWALKKQHPSRRLMRELFDKLVARGKYAEMEKTLKKDTKAIMSDFKTYLQTHKFD